MKSLETRINEPQEELDKLKAEALSSGVNNEKLKASVRKIIMEMHYVFAAPGQTMQYWCSCYGLNYITSDKDIKYIEHINDITEDILAADNIRDTLFLELGKFLGKQIHTYESSEKIKDMINELTKA